MQRHRRDPLIAWRYWQLTPRRLLRSLSLRRFTWSPRRALRASCVAGGHPPPAVDCRCGLYGAPDLAQLRARDLCASADPLVVGEVALWGVIVDDHEGYRGEYAYPGSLWLVEETVAAHERDEVVAALGAYGVAVGTAALATAVSDVSAALIANQAMSRGAHDA